MRMPSRSSRLPVTTAAIASVTTGVLFVGVALLLHSVGYSQDARVQPSRLDWTDVAVLLGAALTSFAFLRESVERGVALGIASSALLLLVGIHRSTIAFHAATRPHAWDFEIYFAVAWLIMTADFAVALIADRRGRVLAIE